MIGPGRNWPRAGGTLSGGADLPRSPSEVDARTHDHTYFA